MSATKIGLRRRQNCARSKNSEAMSAEASPDSKCPICLDIFNNMSYLDICLHKFCFCCIHEWSKNKAECPLCKQPFNSIYHSIKSEQDFKKYDLQPSDNGSFGSFGGARFRYRTTLTGARRQAQRRTSPPPDNGVMFEGVVDRQQQDRGFRRMMMRLAARRRAASEGRLVRTVREQEIIKFRRELYRRGMRVWSVRDGGRSRDTTAEFYQRNPACLHRLVPWLKRELIVLYGAHGSLVNIVQHVIMSRITRYDMEDGAIQEELRPFLQGRTEHFLHEFISFAKSPFNMEAYDQHAVYDCPAPSSNEDSSSNSSVIAISEDEEISLELDPPGDSNSSGALSQSAWDDETPGPSYSTTTERSRAQLLSIPDSDSDSSVEGETLEHRASLEQRSPHNQTDPSKVKVKNNESLFSDDDDCIIIGFVKPTAERTPELVQLSSDSESAHEDTKGVLKLPQHIRFSSPSSPTSQSRVLGGSGQSEGEEVEHNRLGSKESPSTSSRHKSSSKSERKNRDHSDRSGRRLHGGDKSGEMRRSRSGDRRRKKRSRSANRRHLTRSPLSSLNSGSTLSRARRHSRSSSRDRAHAKWDNNVKKRDDAPSHSYHWQSYSRYGRERDDSWMDHTERRSYYSSCHRNLDQRSCSRSPYRSRSRESHHRDRRHSRSRTYSSSCSPSTKRRSRHDKPGGKRKYKTRHLEESPKKPSKSHPEPDSSTSCTKDKKKSKGRHHKKSKERSGNRSRSLSVEIVYEGSSSERSKRHHKKKKKHKKKCKRHKSKEGTRKHSPTVITIDSDSDHSAIGSIGIIGGSGLDDPDILEGRTEHYVDTPYGKPSDALIVGKIKNVECVLLARHGRQHTIMPSNVNYQANIWALREEGCTHLLVTTACGSLREEIQPGDIVIIDQFIDRTTKRAQTLYDGQPTSPPGVCHIPMAEPFCNRTREVLVEVARSLGIKCHARGTMLTIEGPRFSSRAESLMFRQWGADVINMTTVPEVVLAKEAGLCYASIAMATDYDCWKEHEEAVCVDNVLKTMKENANKASSILLTVIPQICQMDWTLTMKALKSTAQSSVMLPKH
ncbi:uncharacterized protein ACJ7VT_018786 isoform 2-T2 [Polymixia lowei]